MDLKKKNVRRVLKTKLELLLQSQARNERSLEVVQLVLHTVC